MKSPILGGLKGRSHTISEAKIWCELISHEIPRADQVWWKSKGVLGHGMTQGIF